MASTIDPLVLDLVEWVARVPRTDGELIDAWRTSCPRLTVWEEAVERGLVERRRIDSAVMVIATARGLDALAAAARISVPVAMPPAVAVA